jgi:hypothetical protein
MPVNGHQHAAGEATLEEQRPVIGNTELGKPSGTHVQSCQGRAARPTRFGLAVLKRTPPPSFTDSISAVVPCA